MPLGIVLVYALTIVARPEVSLHNLAVIGAGHLFRNTTFLLLFLLIALLLSKLEKKEVRGEIWFRAADFLVARWQFDRLLSLLLPPLWLALLLASFTSFKQHVLPLAGFGMDPDFAAIDRALFLGVDPWRITHALLPSTWGTQLLDGAYIAWFIPLLMFVLLSGLLPLRLRTQFLVAFALIWILMGTVLAYLLPGSGPCYYATFHGTADFAPLMDRLHMHHDALTASRGSGLVAVIGQETLLEAYQTRETMLAAGISAMPSLHNAFAVLFACAGFAYSRTIGWTLTLFAFVIWFGSVHLGWHYAIDGLVGGALAVFIWRWTGAMAAQLVGAEAAPEPSAAEVAEPQPSI